MFGRSQNVGAALLVHVPKSVRPPRYRRQHRPRRFTYGLCMTTREELRRLVDELPEDRISVAPVEVQRLASTFDSSGWPPPWFGAVRSERTDTSERVDEPPADGFGR